ncbi:hypothetical protein [Noviherbaspirillum soli]|uniref:hypothetical protein n=1 Tax=Noviherbaspirillum soli TaxID=1064518 RepID=UPI00188B9775|nr:hypothetical protein [Noviherbaspirillum soli]
MTNTNTDTGLPPQSWLIVTQVKSNRVVYYTDDPAYQPPMGGDWYYCSMHDGPLPPAMTLRNCWGWRFNGGVFSDARPAPAPSTGQTLIDSNRKALLALLKEKIDDIRAPFRPRCRDGDMLRQAKLAEARAFLHAPAQAGASLALPLLEAVAVARHISLDAAARLVLQKHKETWCVLHETERFREQFTVALLAAGSQAQLHELRTWLLDRVYPELSRNLRFATPNTEPPQPDAPLEDTRRVHEAARLKVQLRDAINRQRASLHSDYIQNDAMRRHKARLAHELLAQEAGPHDAADMVPLAAYAAARQLDLPGAARLLLQSMARAEALLLRTEALRDRMLARIDAIACERDIVALDLELAELDRQAGQTDTENPDTQ